MERPFYRRFRCLSCDGPVIARVAIERGVATESTNSCSIPTSASNFKLRNCSELQHPEGASASESASEINTGIRLNNYSGIARQSLAMMGFAARLV